MSEKESFTSKKPTSTEAGLCSPKYSDVVDLSEDLSQDNKVLSRIEDDGIVFTGSTVPLNLLQRSQVLSDSPQEPQVNRLPLQRLKRGKSSSCAMSGNNSLGQDRKDLEAEAGDGLETDSDDSLPLRPAKKEWLVESSSDEDVFSVSSKKIKSTKKNKYTTRAKRAEASSGKKELRGRQ